MVSLKVLLLLSSSALMADMVGFTSNTFYVSGYSVGLPESSDSELTDSDIDPYLDLVSTGSSSDEDTKFERPVSTSSFKPEAPKPALSAPKSEESEKPKVFVSRKTVYVPKKTVTKIVKPFGTSFVETEVLGKRPGSFVVEKDLENPKNPRTTAVPEIEDDSFGSFGSISRRDIPPPPPLPPRTPKKASQSRIDRLLSSDRKSVPSYVPFYRPSEDDISSDSDDNLSVYDDDLIDSDDDIFLRYQSPAGYDGMTYATPYDPKLSKSKFQKFKSGTKKRMSEVSKKVAGAVKRTKKETLKHEEDDDSKSKSKSGSKRIPELTEEEKYDITPLPLDKEETKSNTTLADSTKSKIKNMKDSAKGAVSATSKKIHDAAHKTKKRTVSAGKKVKETTSDIKTGIQGKATQVKDKLRGVVPKTKIAMDKIQTSMSKTNLKPKKAFKKIFKTKSGNIEVDEVTHL